jgi:ABC-2 type transport system ATP-binding protein
MPFILDKEEEECKLTAMVETIDIVKEFDGLLAVDRVNLSVEKGEIFGLLGPNGAGKSTTIKMLVTLLKPTSGKTMVAGFDSASQADEVRKRIGYVPQESALDARLTAAENLELFAELYGLSKSSIRNRILEVLELVELDKRKDDLVAHYSGGMKRRLEIARGLLPSPEVLFLDEPTLGLDPQTRRVVWDFIHRLQKEWNLTILATTHYLEEAENEMDRVAIIDKGHIMTMGRPSDLKAEYGHDLVELTIEYPDGVYTEEHLRERIEHLQLTDEVLIKGFELKLSVTDGKKALPSIIHKMDTAGIKINTISVRTPSLDDIFIKYTGRGIREEEGSAETKKQTARLIGRMRSRV